MEVKIKTALIVVVLLSFFPFLHSAGASAQTVCSGEKPEISLGMTGVYWRSYADYVNRQLSVDFQLSSVSDTAYEVTIRQAINTNSVYLSTVLPQTLGDINAGSNLRTTLTYAIPADTWQFRTNLFVSARDDCGEKFFYPTAYHVTTRIIDNPFASQAIDELYLYGLVNNKLYFGIGQTPGWGTGTGYVAKYDLATGNITIIASLKGFTCWQAVNQVINNKLYIFGQGRGGDYHTFALAGYIDLTNDTFVWHEVPNTGDCNEFMGSVYDQANNRFIVGERSAGGDTTGSAWPGGRGLWTIPLATFDNPATYQRVWQDPEPNSSIRTLDIFDNRLYFFASIDSSFRIHIKSAPLSNLASWTDELVGKTGNSKNFGSIWVDKNRNIIYLEKNTYTGYDSELLQKTPGGFWQTTVFNTGFFNFAGLLNNGNLLTEFDTNAGGHDFSIIDPAAGTFTPFNLSLPSSYGMGITRYAAIDHMDKKFYWSFTNAQNPPAEIWECDGF